MNIYYIVYIRENNIDIYIIRIIYMIRINIININTTRIRKYTYICLPSPPPPDPPPPPLLGHSASNSSKNITHGDDERARINTCLTLDSLSPTYILSNSGPFILIKFAPL